MVYLQKKKRTVVDRVRTGDVRVGNSQTVSDVRLFVPQLPDSLNCVSSKVRKVQPKNKQTKNSVVVDQNLLLYRIYSNYERTINICINIYILICVNIRKS